jgi:hypothetical protein
MDSTFNVSVMDKLYPELSKLLKSRDVKVKIFEAYKDSPNELLEAETLIKDPPRNNLGIFLDCTQPFFTSKPIDLILKNYALPMLFRNGS